MNAMPDNFLINSCQYTPVYLIQDPGASQGQSYFIAQNNIEEPKPVSDNLKSFYESSGNIENNVINVNNSVKPRIIKRPESVVGNNLKLASFLLPKNENTNKAHYIVNNVVVKSNVTTSSNKSGAGTGGPGHTVPRLNIDSKIVKLRNLDLRTKYNRVERCSPKTKPKEIVQPTTAAMVPPPSTVLPSAPSKHTSVQLLKLGETYHSLNQLSDEQMKMVTQALKIFSNPEKIAPEPTYDPVTNTKFIYKVVSPRDLTVVGKNKILSNKTIVDANIDTIINNEIRKESVREPTKKEIYLKEVAKKDILIKAEARKEIMMRAEVKRDAAMRRIEERRQKILREIHEEPEPEITETKVTRSGRKVKLPKPIINLPEGSPHKPKKKKTFVKCFQCSTEFNSLYRLQKHYESHPTHIPAKIHSNLFHCLLAIVKGGSEEDRTNIFIQQLEQLIVKLRSLLPCLLKNEGAQGKPCTISEDVSRLLGMDPGKYNFDIDALTCVKNKDGYCTHNKPPPVPCEANQSQSWITMNNESILTNCETETEDCARINSVEKWPTVNKRVWKLKQQKSEDAKRMRLSSETGDAHIDLGIENLVALREPDAVDGSCAIISQPVAEHKADTNLGDKLECNQFSYESGTMLTEVPDLQPTESLCLNPEPDTPSFLDTSDCTSLLHPEPLPNLEPTTLIMTDDKGHPQFHSAHFDIRSSPIKPSTSTIFRKFQINPELLAKYEADTIRTIETVKDHGIDSELDTSAEVPSQDDSNDILNDKQMMQFDNDKCTLSHKEALQEIFKDEDLNVVKDTFTLDKDLKDWILNRSNDDKSEDGFSKSSTLIEPALLHVNDDQLKSSISNEIEHKDGLPPSDNHDESSVLNFLDSLASDCLSYPGTEIRTNNGDFQLDLFSFHSS